MKIDQPISLKSIFMLVLFVCTSYSYAQTRGSIEGNITTSDGAPAAFVNVIVTGTHF